MIFMTDNPMTMAWVKFVKPLNDEFVDEYGRTFGHYPESHICTIPIDYAWLLQINGYIRPVINKGRWMISMTTKKKLDEHKSTSGD